MPGEALTHPEHDILSAFGLGKLPPERAREVEAHITECDPCCQTLLDLQSDTFVDLVRSSNDGRAHGLENEARPGDTATHMPSGGGRSAVPPELADHPRYRRVESLGQGGMGDIFKAEHRLMNRMVALKVINRDLLAEPTVVDRFRREVQAAAQLSHPNIVTAYDAEEVGDVHVLAMELVDGTDLSAFVKQKGPLAVDVACDFVCQAAAGLQHAHDCGMVHRDIKPHNLMVTSNGRIKILDFGLATLSAKVELAPDTSQIRGAARTNGLVAGDVACTALQNRLTNVGCTMGTPDFISPEQAADAHAADARSDIYSLGCTLYFLLTGTPPFAAGTTEEKLDAHSRREPPSLEQFREDVPEQLANAIRRMMAKVPAARFQTPEDLAVAMEPFAMRRSSSELPLATVSTRSGRQHRRWALATSAAVLLLLAGVFLAQRFGFLSDGPAEPPGSAARTKGSPSPTDESTVAKKPKPDINASTEHSGVFHSPSADATPRVFRSIFQLEIVIKRGEDDAQVMYADGTVVATGGLLATVIDEPRTEHYALEIESATLLMLDGSSAAAEVLAFDPAYGVALLRVEDPDLPHLTLSKTGLVAKQRVTWHAVYKDGRRTFLYTRPACVHKSAHTVGETEDLCEIIDVGTSALTSERSGSALVTHDGCLAALMGRQEHWNVTPKNGQPRKKLAWAVPAHVIARLVASVGDD